MRDLELLEQLAELLRGEHRRGSDQDRLPLGVPARNVAHDGLPLAILGAEDSVGVVPTRDGQGRRDACHRQPVDVHELLGLRQR